MGACDKLVYCMFNSDLFNYANHFFVNIYAFIQSNIVRAILFNLQLCERRDVRATACGSLTILVDRSSRAETGCPGSCRRTAAIQTISSR